MTFLNIVLMLVGKVEDFESYLENLCKNKNI